MSVDEDEVALGAADPRAGDGAALVAELVAFLEPLYPEDEEEDPAPWSVDDVAEAFVLARVAGAAAACGGLVPCAEPGTLEVVRMYVRPGFRGRRLADRVLAWLEQTARARGAEALMLRCGPQQPDALWVYERNGYARRGPFAYHREHPTNVFFEKRLV
jgi:GNAT superfamily N-acetyltransferase